MKTLSGAKIQVQMQELTMINISFYNSEKRLKQILALTLDHWWVMQGLLEIILIIDMDRLQ